MAGKAQGLQALGNQRKAFGVMGGDRGAGNQLFRELKMKIGNTHDGTISKGRKAYRKAPFLATQRMRVKRHLQPAIAQAWRAHPQRRW